MFHKEGFKIIRNTTITLLIVNGIAWYLFGESNLIKLLTFTSVVFSILILQFFRNPKRVTPVNSNQVIAPADGKIVVLEETLEHEYFKDKRIQVSIFMSPFNVHVNRYPISGEVKFTKYHPGKFLVAWHPKSSTENERTTIVVESEKTGPILLRQIAGAVAKRIVLYAKIGEQCSQGHDMGFIKFGSRVDLFLPLDAKINIKINDTVKGAQTIIASF
ncbi:MAG: phosphatidylserine decarboxylase family protein [Flavobacteriales bacterium]